MRPYDARLIARDPFGEKKGPLPEPLQFTVTHTARGYPTMTIMYSDRSARSDWLEGPLEVQLETSTYGTFTEPLNGSRFLVTKRSWDEHDKLKVRKYECVGLGFLLQRMRVWDPDDVDPGDPVVRPVRTFKTKFPGQMMVPLFNAALARVFPDGLVLHPPEKHFELLTDANDADWEAEVPGTQTFRIEEPLSAVEAMLIQAELAEPVWSSRLYKLFNWGTYGRDLTDSVKPIIIRPTFDIQSAPEEEDLTDLTARVVAVGEQGSFTYKEYDPLDPPDLSYGAWEAGVTAGGSDDPSALLMTARQAFRTGKAASSQITREGHSGTVGPRPYKDFEAYDHLWVFRPSKSGAERRQKVECVETSITWTKGKGVERWHATFGDRHMDRELRHAARQYRATLGTQGGTIPDPPGPDQRVPLAPDNVVCVTTNITSSGGESRGDQLLTWDAVLYAEDPDNPGLPADPPVPINLEGYEVGEQRFGVTSRIAQVGPTQLSWRRDNVLIGARDLKVRAIMKGTLVRGAYSAPATADVIAEQEAITGQGLVQDGRHINGAIRTARAADAGSGFSFVSESGEYVAAFTSTTPTLAYGVGGTPTGGRRACKPGDEIVVGGDVKKQAGTSVSARFDVRFWDFAGNTISTLTALTAVAGASYASVTPDFVVAPAGSAMCSVRVHGVTFTGTSPELRVKNVTGYVRSDQYRLSDGAAPTRVIVDDAVISDKIHATNNLTTKHTSTGALLQGASGTSQWKGGLTGLYYYIGGVANFSATASGVYVKGVIETGSGMIIGGAGFLDIVFASGFSIGTNGGFLEYNASGGHKFNDSVNMSGACTIGGSVIFNGSTFVNNGAATVNASGTTLGFYGATRVVKQATSTVVMTNQATIIQAVNTLASKIAATGLITNNIS